MKKIMGKLYYTIKFGGGYYVWLRISSKIFNNKNNMKFLYKKSLKMSSDKYEEALIKIYGSKTGKKLNLKKPQTFNEKIQWMKLYDTTLLKTTLADKYLVRTWVKEKIGEKYLIPLLGVWDTFKSIKIGEMPHSFVLKANHGSGWIIVIKDKEKADWKKIGEKLDCWMDLNYAFMKGFEMQYFGISPKIIAEKYIENSDGNLYDYKIHCFNGKPEYIQVMGNRDLDAHHAMHAFYDTEWNLQSFTYSGHSRYKNEKEKPANLGKLLQLAEILSEGFFYVRVDLYELDNGEIKFGEMTFTPASGFIQWIPSEMDNVWGEKIKLPLDKHG